MLRARQKRKGRCWVSFKHVRWGVMHHISVVEPEWRASWSVTESAERLEVVELLRMVSLGREGGTKTALVSFTWALVRGKVHSVC